MEWILFKLLGEIEKRLRYNIKKNGMNFIIFLHSEKNLLCYSNTVFNMRIIYILITCKIIMFSHIEKRYIMLINAYYMVWLKNW